YLQAAAYRIEIPPASHFGRQITKKLKAERRLTHRWIHLIVVQKNLHLGALRLVVPSAANSSIGRALGCFSVFLRTHPSQTLFCTYHKLLAILNFLQLSMTVLSERHVMQLDKRLLKLARTLWLIVSSRSAGPQKILNGKCFFSLQGAWVAFECRC